MFKHSTLLKSISVIKPIFNKLLALKMINECYEASQRNISFLSIVKNYENFLYILIILFVVNFTTIQWNQITYKD